jgi:IclR family acetate operon transcriptional repressor
MSGASNDAPATRVQSVDRAFQLLDILTEAEEPQGLTQLAAASGLPLPTVHRLIGALTARGYVRQERSRRYTLGARLVLVGQAAGRSFGRWAQPSLRRLVELTGETANLAILDGDSVVYIAQVLSPHPMRMFTEPGRRTFVHSTGVGKALLAQLPPAEVTEILGRTGMPAQTPRTVTDPDRLLADLAEIRRRGYALDDGEQELGVRCVAVAMPGARALSALSVSGPEVRMGDEVIREFVPSLQAVRDELSGRASAPAVPAQADGAVPD